MTYLILGVNGWLAQKFNEYLEDSEISKVDITDLECLREELDEKKPEVVINCAGIMPWAETKKVMDINFWGTYYIMNNLYPVMTEGGCIINIASVSGIMCEPEFPIYAASKAAIISLTKSFAKSLAPKIRVNCISPGFYNTNLFDGSTPKELIDKIPMGYEEEPINLLPVIKMIWETKYLTGANIVVDGGLSL